MRGIATGANDFFVFNQSKAKEYGIEPQYLLSCVCKCADVKGQLFTKKDFDLLMEKDKNVFLLNASKDMNSEVQSYLMKGKSEGIDKK